MSPWTSLGRASSWPAILVQSARTMLRSKELFGADGHIIATGRWIADFEQTGINPEVRPWTMKENAQRLPGLF